MLSELENALLALIALHPHASGYDLHRVIEDSTGHMLSASFSQIYPALRKLGEGGLVVFDVEPIKNRPGKKRYALTEEGERQLQLWLKSPVDFSRGFNPLDLRVAFMPLMDKDSALGLLDGAIAELQAELADPRGGGRDPQSYGFLDEGAVDMRKLDYIWQEAARRFRDERAMRLSWLQELRRGVQELF